MEYGLIKDTTLTAIADAMRDKGMLPKYKKDIRALKYKAPNATSLDDPTPIYEQSAESISITMPQEAVGTELIIDVGYYQKPDADPFYDGHGAGTIYVRAYGVSYNIPVSKNSERHYTYIIPAPTVTISVEDNTIIAKQKDWISCIVTAYPLDANNNRIPIDTEEIDTASPSEMAEALAKSAKVPPESAFTLTGDCTRLFEAGKWKWFIDNYEDIITTEDISNMSYMFSSSREITKLPFVFNVNNLSVLTSAFSGMSDLVECPKVRGTFHPTSKFSGDSCFSGCNKLTDIEDFVLPEMLDFFVTQKCTSAYSPPRPISFSSCNLLRKVPTWWYKFRLAPDSTAFPNASYSMYYYMISSCYMLDEIKNIPVWVCTAPATSNLFGSTFSGNCYLKAFTFETNEGQPIVANWKSQTIDLSGNIGYTTGSGHINAIQEAGYTDKRVFGDENYQALKDDPDYWTTLPEYGKYNHDSAVETINSLPDTSAYLSTAGGTNTIKFKKACGAATAGGAIENLTAEEIAVAAAKGWTVTLV